MIKQITVLTQNDIDWPIETMQINAVGNDLVIHRTPIRDDGSDSKYQFTYTITHRATGRRMIVCRNLLQAKQVKEQLNNLPIDWSLSDIDELKKAALETNYFEIYKAHDIDYLENRKKFDL